MVTGRIKSFLNERNIRYAVIEHSPAYTAQEVAASAHIPGREMVKTVIVEVEGKPSMVALPATNRVAIDDLKRIIGSEDVRLAHESEIERLFPDCETGAMPPLGNLYNLDVYVHPALAASEMIAFNAGSHVSLIRMAYADFEKLVKPKVLTLV